MMKAWMEIYKPLLVRQDPLAIGYHWHRMSTLMHTYMARIPALSGIDMALWDLAGPPVGLPVYKLLGGPFRERCPVFINTEPRNMLDPKMVKDWADQFRANPLGVQGHEDQHPHHLRHSRWASTPPRPTRARTSTSCACRSTTSAKNSAWTTTSWSTATTSTTLPPPKPWRAPSKSIQPKWFEDPLPPQFSDSWVALKRDCRVPLLTGEKCEMPQGFYPFLKEQAVDYIYPDIAFCGGITAFMKIASMAALFRIPVATHNVGGIHLTMACIHVGLSIMDFLTSETAMGGPRRRPGTGEKPTRREEGYCRAPEGRASESN